MGQSHFCQSGVLVGAMVSGAKNWDSPRANEISVLTRLRLPVILRPPRRPLRDVEIVPLKRLAGVCGASQGDDSVMRVARRRPAGTVGRMPAVWFRWRLDSPNSNLRGAYMEVRTWSRIDGS